MTNRQSLSVGASRAAVFACWLVYTFAYVARNTYSASIVSLTAAGMLTKEAAGVVGTCYFFCYGAGHFINGVLADRLPPDRMIAAGLAGTTACNLIMPAVTPTLWAMIAVWSAHGFLQAMIWPPIINVLSGRISAKIRDRSLVVISTTVPVGTVLAYLTTSLCQRAGVGWRAPYFIAAALALTALASFTVIARPALAAAGEPEDEPPAPAASPRSVAALLAASGAFIFLIPVVFHGMLKDGILTWVPTMISETYGTSESLSTLLTVGLPLSNLFGALISNTLYTRAFRRNHAATGACVMLLAAVPTAIVVNASALPLAAGVACLCVLSMLTSGFNYLFSTLLPARFAVFGRTSTVSGVFNSSIYVGSAISTYVFGALAERFSWSATVALWLALTLVSAAVLAFSARRWRRFLDSAPK